MTRLSDLSPEQIRLMVKLDDGFDHLDSVGIEHARLSDEQDFVLGSLIIEGLATIDEGRGGHVWARLTEMGRKVREEGEA